MTRLSDYSRLKRSNDKAKIGIIHFGPGAFFRAFNAIYTHEVLQSDGGNWGIMAVSLRSDTAQKLLASPDFVYTSITLGEEENETQIIGSISDVLVATQDPNAVLIALQNPSIKVVSLTITEKGYCHEPSTGELNLDHPDILHDLANPSAPKTAAGYIVEALSKRKQDGQSGFTVLSCDNLAMNGKVAKNVVLGLAKKRDTDLAKWIEREISFPSTMVDRITPATTNEDVEQLAISRKYFDPACVKHEAFRQWVIEDNFVSGRPNWESAGAQFVKDVSPFETMKLRCLNGTHSALAYLGYLAGFKIISDVIADEDFANYCKRLWAEEIIPAVETPEGEKLDDYCSKLFARYKDRGVRHLTWQIAMDGSQKLPQRLLSTIADNLDAGRSISGLCLAVAAWMRYVGGIDEKGVVIDVRDPLADELKKASNSQNGSQQKVEVLLAFEQIFPIRLATNQHFKEELVSAFSVIEREGAAQAVNAFVNTRV